MGTISSKEIRGYDFQGKILCSRCAQKEKGFLGHSEWTKSLSETEETSFARDNIITEEDIERVEDKGFIKLFCDVCKLSI